MIEENEAAVVRRIFNAFEKGATIRDIVASLNSDGIPSPMKKKWCPNQIASVLNNERYAGDVLTNKYYTKDHISHKLVKNRGDVEQYLLEDHHTPIIGREQFDRVQLIREMKRSSSYPFNGLLVCPHCGRKLEFKGNFLGPKRSAWCCELDEFYIAARPLPGAVLEAYRQMEAKEGPAKQVKDEFPVMKTVDYWWLDRLVDSITFGEHAGEDDQTLTVNWTDGQTTTVPSGNGLMHKLIHQVRYVYENVEYYRKLVEEAKEEYEKARLSYSKYADAHGNSILESVNSRKEELENELQLKNSNYTAYNTQLQASIAKLQQRTPAFTLLQGAAIPIKPSGPKRMIFVLAMLMLVSMITAGRILWKNGKTAS